MKSRRPIRVILGLFILLLCAAGSVQAQSFSSSQLNFNGNGGVNQGTSLMFGPDGRLYVLQLNGTIDIFTIQRNGVDDYVVTASEELLLVKNIPNHNDDGSSNANNNREATGITVAGTASNPVIYATSSDSRVGGPGGDANLDTNSGVITRITWTGSSWDAVDIVRGLPRSEENHATNGLEFVTIGGTDYLIVASGGFTNAGSPSDNFAWTTEYALSAAILSVNLTMLEAMPIQNDGVRNYIYDIPTLDDPTRANANGITDPDSPGYNGIDVNDPWGGNDGLNQAMVVEGGPVQIFSPGYRNSYDLVVTQDGKVYATDNGANGGWGGLPVNEGTANVNNDYISSEPGSSASVGGEQVNNQDHLTLITTDIQSYTFGSFYGGHPAPVRANPAGAGLFTNPEVNSYNPATSVFRTLIYDPDGSTPGSTTNPNIALPANWPPVPVSLANPDEGDWRGPGIGNPDGPSDVLVTTWGTNTNGIDEYTASNFAGAMQGNLLAGTNGGALRRVELNASGNLDNLTNTFISNLGGNALGITCNSDSDPFPGTIWVAPFNGSIVVLEPQDFVICILPGEAGYDPLADNDGDGYTNQDEIDNLLPGQTIEQVICNGGNQPNDFDKNAGGTLVSDLNDNDDDADGIPDGSDPMQLGNPIDSGSDAFDLPVLNDLLSDNPVLQGYLGLGFTGMMNNGDTGANWLNWLDRRDDPADPNPNDILGGATGSMTMQMTAGTALGTANTQEKAFQYGVNVSTATGGFTVESRLFNFNDPLQLYDAASPANGELGIFIGDGTQSNYIKLVITKNGINALQELDDTPQTLTELNVTIDPSDRPANAVTFSFVVDPTTGLVTLQYQFDNDPVQTLGTMNAGGAILTAIQNAGTPLMVGFIGSSNATGEEVEGTWDTLNVQGSQPAVEQDFPEVSVLTGASATSLNLDEFFSDDGGDGNLTYTIQNNTDPAIGASISGSTLNLTFPATAATSNITIRAADTGGLFIEQVLTVNVSDEPVPIVRIRANGATIAATDAGNPDWVGVTATGAQNGTSNGFSWSVNTGNHSTHNIAGRHASVPAYVPQALFANERWDPEAAPEMQWDIALPNNESYVVRLYMGNGFAGTSGIGQRVFDISIEGNLVQNDLDLVQTFGHQVGGMLEYQVNLTDGTLNILFEHVTENPTVNGIEILSLGGSFAPPISVEPIANQTNFEGDLINFNVAASGGDSNENFGYSATGMPPGISIEPTTGLIFGNIDTGASAGSPYNPTVTVSKPGSASVQVNFSWTVLDPSTTGTALFRVNAGGALTPSNDADPKSWDADQTVATPGGTATTGTPSPYVNSAAEDETFGAAVTTGFTNTTGYPDALFTTERYNTLAVPDNMQWDFPVPNGNYTVNLLFAEIWTGAQTAGVRVFDVEIEGNLVLDDLDQTAAYGWETAAVETFAVTVTDGNLDIDFIQGIQNPSIKGIEILPSGPPAELQWTDQTDDENYTARHEASFVQAGDKFYLFGGRENSSSLDVYDYQSKTWSTISNSAPSEFNHFQALEYNGLIWVIGAFKNNAFPNELPADYVWAYNPAQDTWIQGPEIPPARKRGSAGLVVYNDKFYVIAGNTIGHNGGYQAWFDEFDPATGVWTTLTDAPRARDHFHAEVIGDKLYVAGGRLSGGTGGTFAPLIAEVDVYDFTSGTWSTLPSGQNLPTPRGAASVAVFQNELYVIGGEIGVDLQGNTINDAQKTTESYNPVTGTWTTRADLITERHGTQAIVSGDGIHITAGSNTQGGGGTMKNMEFYGTDNPSGTPLTAGQLSVASSLTVTTGGASVITLNNAAGNTGIIVTGAQLGGGDAGNFQIVSDLEFRFIPPGGSLDVFIGHTGATDGDVALLTFQYDGTNSSPVALTSGESQATVLYRINTGGPLTAATDSPNPDWEQDTGVFGTAGNSTYLTGATATGGTFDQSSASAYQGPIVMTDPSLPAGTPVSIFQTERFDAAAAPEMTWAFPVTAGTTVEVRLYFAELFNGITAAEQRVFDVSVEGSVPAAFNDIDQFARNGALGAFMLSHTLVVSDGTLNLEFIHGVENPNIKAIEIIDLGGTPVNTPPVVTNPGIQQGVEGDAVSLAIQASDLDPCGPLTYSAEGLPPSLNINPSTGVITGTLDEGSGSGVAGAYIENGGLVMIEAENDFTDTPGGWNPLTDSGVDYLVASTNHFGDTNGQTVDYSFQINTPGVYRFHMKSAISGTVFSDENDTWFRIVNTPDVHFFCVLGSANALSGTSEFEGILAGNPTSKEIFYPAGNAMGRPDHGTENPGVNGFFKVYRSGSGGNKWSTITIDNSAGTPVYAYFPNAGTFTISMSERSAGHRVDRFALVHIDDVSTGTPTTTLDNAPQSQQTVGGTPGAADNSPYNVTVTVADGCDPALSSTVDFVWNVTDTPPTGTPSALFEITPGSGIDASTYGANSLQLTNTSTGNIQITSITIDLSTGILPDNVFDPVGTGGDATASCFTANSGAAATGLIAPADPCVDPFSQPRNGGYDVMSLSFSEFDPSEALFFTVDVDPNSIQGVPGAGAAGAVSGFELVGATITISFSDGSTVVGSLYEDGSFGGSQILTGSAPTTPSISMLDVGTGPATVADLNQVMQISGNPGDYVSLLQMDSRLYIASGDPPFNVPDPTYYANEAVNKALYTGQIPAGGTLDIPVTLLQTASTDTGPDGGLNQFIAVSSTQPYAVDQPVSNTSNVVTILYDPNFQQAQANLSYTLQGRTDYTADLTVEFYETGQTTPSLSFTVSGDATGTGLIEDLPVGDYSVAVKADKYLQRVIAVSLVDGPNTINFGQLLAGDANNDNQVTGLDFSILAGTYNLTSGDTGYDDRADFNGDGQVTGLDFSLLASNYNVSGEIVE
ncbi:malectin domain-containing carbohydrate-binding protein [Robiginitalea sp. SC105]|uniref:malectin domain-containing carbohydrate-binding protein n=1 Tax=Robiginitalea sp. SC105 TaxID=2762332 RepID=UPI00163B0EC6|nr:malectin domain-containing carbohydrate-binding protein [Robiginitalea sp. SC105]MBC2840231.1 putative Ig domain-containing protein [Robiginitalea sp. SC105]